MFVPPADAGPASSIAIDPAHDNNSPGPAIASPLSIAWSVDLGGPSSAPLVADGLVIVTRTSPAGVLAIDPASGSTVWGPVALNNGFFKGLFLAAQASRVFILNANGLLVALDARTGAELWTLQIEIQYSFDSPPVAADGLVFVNGTGEGGDTYAIDATNGSVAWTATNGGSQGAVAVADSVVYVSGGCQQMWAFDVASGSQIWYAHTDCSGGDSTAPSVYGNHIWQHSFLNANTIFDTTGKITGSFNADVTPAFSGNAVFYLQGSMLDRVDLTSSVVGWTFAGDGSLSTAPVVVGNQLFVGGTSGNVYEIDVATGTQVSVCNVGVGADGGQISVVAGSETEAMTVASGRLIVPTSSGVVAF